MHVIEKVNLNIKLKNENKAFEFRQNLQPKLESQIQELLEKILTDFDKSDQIYHIDALNISLDNIDYEMIEHDFMKILEQKIRNKLHDIFILQNYNILSYKDVTTNKDKKELANQLLPDSNINDLQLIEHFLTKSYLPWWGKALIDENKTIYNLIYQTSKEKPTEFNHLLKKVITNKYARKRLISHFSNNELKDIAIQLFPTLKNEIYYFSTQQYQTFERLFNSVLSPQKLKLNLWEQIFIKSFYHTAASTKKDSSFEKELFESVIIQSESPQVTKFYTNYIQFLQKNNLMESASNTENLIKKDTYFKAFKEFLETQKIEKETTKKIKELKSTSETPQKTYDDPIKFDKEGKLDIFYILKCFSDYLHSGAIENLLDNLNIKSSQEFFDLIIKNNELRQHISTILQLTIYSPTESSTFFTLIGHQNYARFLSYLTQKDEPFFNHIFNYYTQIITQNKIAKQSEITLFTQFILLKNTLLFYENPNFYTQLFLKSWTEIALNFNIDATKFQQIANSPLFNSLKNYTIEYKQITEKIQSKLQEADNNNAQFLNYFDKNSPTLDIYQKYLKISEEEIERFEEEKQFINKIDLILKEAFKQNDNKIHELFFDFWKNHVETKTIESYILQFVIDKDEKFANKISDIYVEKSPKEALNAIIKWLFDNQNKQSRRDFIQLILAKNNQQLINNFILKLYNQNIISVPDELITSIYNPNIKPIVIKIFNHIFSEENKKDRHYFIEYLTQKSDKKLIEYTKKEFSTLPPENTKPIIEKVLKKLHPRLTESLLLIFFEAQNKDLKNKLFKELFNEKQIIEIDKKLALQTSPNKTKTLIDYISRQKETTEKFYQFIVSKQNDIQIAILNQQVEKEPFKTIIYRFLNYKNTNLVQHFIHFLTDDKNSIQTVTELLEDENQKILNDYLSEYLSDNFKPEFSQEVLKNLLDDNERKKYQDKILDFFNELDKNTVKNYADYLRKKHQTEEFTSFISQIKIYDQETINIQEITNNKTIALFNQLLDKIKQKPTQISEKEQTEIQKAIENTTLESVKKLIDKIKQTPTQITEEELIEFHQKAKNQIIKSLKELNKKIKKTSTQISENAQEALQKAIKNQLKNIATPKSNPLHNYLWESLNQTEKLHFIQKNIKNKESKQTILQNLQNNQPIFSEIIVEIPQAPDLLFNKIIQQNDYNFIIRFIKTLLKNKDTKTISNFIEYLKNTQKENTKNLIINELFNLSDKITKSWLQTNYSADIIESKISSIVNTKNDKEFFIKYYHFLQKNKTKQEIDDLLVFLTTTFPVSISNYIKNIVPKKSETQFQASIEFLSTTENNIITEKVWNIANNEQKTILLKHLSLNQLKKTDYKKLYIKNIGIFNLLKTRPFNSRLIIKEILQSKQDTNEFAENIGHKTIKPLADLYFSNSGQVIEKIQLLIDSISDAGIFSKYSLAASKTRAEFIFYLLDADKKIQIRPEDLFDKFKQFTRLKYSFYYDQILKNSYNSKTLKQLGLSKPHADLQLKSKEAQRINQTEQLSRNYTALPDDDAIFISNSGLIILTPYLKPLFTHLELLNEKGNFKNEETLQKAIFMLQYAVEKHTQVPEYELALNKILCGATIDYPLDDFQGLSDKEKQDIENLLVAVSKHWTALKGMGADSIRVMFLKRDGKFKSGDRGWDLKVERKDYDLLVERLPWTISMIKTPWMNRMLYTEW